MDILKLLPVFVLILSSFGIPMPMANAEDVTETFEGGMDLQITYPESVMIGRTFSVSIYLENNGWENKQDISFTITNPDSAFIALGSEIHQIPELTTSSHLEQRLIMKFPRIQTKENTFLTFHTLKF